MQPATGGCSVKKKLTEQYARAVSELNRAQDAQFAALRRDEGFLYDAEIAQAREEVEKLKQAISDHRREHGC
jgi:hypothetical protein